MNPNTLVDQFPYNELSMSVPLNNAHGFAFPVSSIPYESEKEFSRSFIGLLGGCSNLLERHLPYMNSFNDHFTLFRTTHLPLPQDKPKEHTSVMEKMEFNNLKQEQAYVEHHLSDHTASVTP